MPQCRMELKSIDWVFLEVQDVAGDEDDANTLFYKMYIRTVPPLLGPKIPKSFSFGCLEKAMQWERTHACTQARNPEDTGKNVKHL